MNLQQHGAEGAPRMPEPKLSRGEAFAKIDILQHKITKLGQDIKESLVPNRENAEEELRELKAERDKLRRENFDPFEGVEPPNKNEPPPTIH